MTNQLARNMITNYYNTQCHAVITYITFMLCNLMIIYSTIMPLILMQTDMYRHAGAHNELMMVNAQGGKFPPLRMHVHYRYH